MIMKKMLLVFILFLIVQFEWKITMPIMVFGIERTSYNFINPGLSTFFSENYSEANFDDIEVGMRKNEVVESLGEPLITNDDDDYWHYGYRREKSWVSNFFSSVERSIEFDETGKVERINKNIILSHD